MVKKRTEHHLKNAFYKDVILKKLKTLYSGCVPCMNVYLVPCDMRFYNGFVNVYCSLFIVAIVQLRIKSICLCLLIE